MVALVQVAIRNGSGINGGILGVEIEFGMVWWFVYAGISYFLVLFAGIMSVVCLCQSYVVIDFGSHDLGLIEPEILQCSGTPCEKRTGDCNGGGNGIFHSLMLFAAKPAVNYFLASIK
ncbi:protein of unknown function-containing protein-like [Forsythia ovata]|uniref:Uncharacterized protein n=1 Tax=Forsythia ovata TaxID=205694 RepID=A0ABD1TTQ2_9LAMI